MEIRIVDGTPVVLSARDKAPVTIRFRKKKPKKRITHNISRSKQLNMQQRTALKNYFEGATKTNAGLAAGYKAPIQAVNNALSLAVGNKEFLKAMKKDGIDNESLSGVLKDGLKAEHPFKPGRKDWHAIHKFWNDAVKIQDGFPATKTAMEINKKTIHIHLTKADSVAAEKYERLKEGVVDAEVVE